MTQSGQVVESCVVDTSPTRRSLNTMRRKVAITLAIVAAFAVATGAGWKWEAQHRQGTRQAGWTWDEGRVDNGYDGWVWTDDDPPTDAPVDVPPAE